jgi:hypothetical protein
MAIYRILENSAFWPEEIDILGHAYENALRVLQLADRADPATEIVAEKIIKTFQIGDKICALALRDPGIRDGK